MLPGGYEEIVWNNFTLSHDVVGSYDYANTSLPVATMSSPAGGSVLPPSGLWPYVTGAETDPFMIRSMHRMYVEAELIVSGHNPVTTTTRPVTGSSYGAWRALFSSRIESAGITYEEAKLGNHTRSCGWQCYHPRGVRQVPLPKSQLDALVTMQNGGDFDAPPCGQLTPVIQAEIARDCTRDEHG